ncbi:hypothetical protein [Streptococcus anginosus]|uniref:hypothetical protein n=1 Tax=Streptococcus anginosus TaxID=1328 RepID=UPI000D0939B8|nr:hypothetical protein [Streptococcus anginosus]PRT71643.1 hypothetical protein C6A32_01925 [Streptococcus anginosus]VTS33304.1 Uncharacterised protein [Streptococcus anginosus]
MTRKNYFELIQDMEFNADKEFEIISKLISEKRSPSSITLSLISLQNVFNVNFILYLKYRKIQFTSYDEVNKYFKNNMNGTERLFSYIEFIIDLYSFLKKNTGKMNNSDRYNYYLISNSFREIEDRINYSLDKTNHELIELDSGNRIIVEKNVYASEVSQIVSETSIQDAIKVLEYNHFANKGNIERKKEILISLATYLEPFRDELNDSEELKEVMKVNNNKKIIAVEQLFNMYNNLGLRHNNNKQYHLEMTEEELEQWYDDIYASTLFVILSLDEARILSKLKTLRNG